MSPRRQALALGCVRDDPGIGTRRCQALDAAWGGALIAAPRLRAMLDGIELANSITLDAHKWFATTYGMRDVPGSGTVDPVACLPSHGRLHAIEPGDTVDPYVTSIQWSRRFLGLRLFLSLAAADWHGYAEHIERAVSLTGLLSDELRARGWTIANNSPVAVLCFLPPDGSASVNDIANRVDGSGKTWISVAQYEHHPVPPPRAQSAWAWMDIEQSELKSDRAAL